MGEISILVNVENSILPTELKCVKCGAAMNMHAVSISVAGSEKFYPMMYLCSDFCSGISHPTNDSWSVALEMPTEQCASEVEKEED